MNTAKAALKKGEVVTGCMVTVMTHPDIIKIMQVCGFDLVIIDCEHGSMGYDSVAALLGVARALDFPCLVRIPGPQREYILKYMDAGAAGILLPNCETAEEAALLASHALYAPEGNRGVAMMRPHAGYRRPSSPVEYMRSANEDCLLMCQIESPVGVDNIDAILDVPGIDAAFVGPNDLSQSYGLMGQFDHPTVVGAIEKVVASAEARGKWSGIHMGAPDQVRQWIAKGMRLNLWSNELALMVSAATAGLKAIRA